MRRRTAGHTFCKYLPKLFVVVITQHRSTLRPGEGVPRLWVDPIDPCRGIVRITQKVSESVGSRPPTGAAPPVGPPAVARGRSRRPANAVVALDAHLRVTAWNRAAERLYGLAAGEMLGTPFGEHVLCHPHPPIHRHGRRRPPDAIGLVSGAATHVVQGRSIRVQVSLMSFRRRGGARYFLAVIKDDAERLELAASLRERLDFEMLLSELSARFNRLSEDEVDGEIEAWLPRLVEMLGVDRSSFSELTPGGGLNVTHAYAAPGVVACPKGVADDAFPWLVREFTAGRSVTLSRVPDDLPEQAVEERRYMTTAGMKASIGIPVSIAGSLVCVLTFGSRHGPRAWSQEVVSRLKLAGDVFAHAIVRRHAKRRLEQKQQELAHVARVAAMGELASVIAHEIDQPLTAVVSNVEAVRYMLQAEGPDLGEADEGLKEAIDSALRISEIVKRERRLLRKSGGPPGLVDLNEAVREIVLFVRAEARQLGTKLVLELVPGLPAVPGDFVQLQQVALNLARNGLHAMKGQPPASRELTIRTTPGNEEVILSVSDCGPPVPESLLERMFEPFYTTKAEGLGMGLPISRSIIEAHRGRIWAARNPGGGLTVSVSLPRK
jgi:PAS domain S-box-containing protein